MNINKIVIALLLACASAVSFSQPDPVQTLAGAILQLQVGRPNPSWYGQQLWQTIAMQTNNTGIYPQLVALGPVTNVVVNQTQQLPGGNLYAMTVTHQNGTSSWQFGIANYPPRIEYAEFHVGGFPSLNPNANTNTNPNTNSNPLPPPPPGQTSAKPGSESESCRRFPNLCP